MYVASSRARSERGSAARLRYQMLLRRLGWISQRASLLAGTQTGTRGVELGLVLLGANDPAPPQLLTSAWEEEASSPGNTCS